MNKFIKRYLEWQSDFKEVEIRSRTLRLVNNTVSEMKSKYNIDLKKIKGNLYEYSSAYNITSSIPYLNGEVFIQAEPSYDVVELLDPKKDDLVLDMCAAPGSKTIHIAELIKEGSVIALEKNNARLKKLKYNLERMHVDNVISIKADASIWKSDVKFDKILLDAPCSGNYTVERDWFKKRSLIDIKNKALTQKKLIENASKLIKTDGVLIYSTCSLEKEEDEQIVEYAQKLGFKLEFEKKYWPHLTNTIGFYMAKLIYKGK